MDDNTTRRKRVRIGLTLAPDVADILSEHATQELTRTKIIEQAVRNWELRQRGEVQEKKAKVRRKVEPSSDQQKIETQRTTFCPRHRPKWCAPDCEFRQKIE